MPVKRKKWTEEEERCLIDKYASMQSDGSLSRLRTREKKFRPIADHVTASHHAADPATYPFRWTWKDVSTKVQNMRHQYLLVKSKLISAVQSPSDGPDWSDGLSLWPNFLLYRDVFGDAPLPPKPPVDEGEFIDGDLGLGLGFECCNGGDEVDEEGFDYEEVAPPPLPPLPPRNKKKRRRRRGEEEREREWEERMERRREEWRGRMEGMMREHRAEMEQMHGRVIAEQQAVIGQLLGIVSHWAGGGGIGGGGGGGISDGGGGIHGYGGQMNGIGVVPVEGRLGGDGHEDDQFIVDG